MIGPYVRIINEPNYPFTTKENICLRYLSPSVLASNVRFNITAKNKNLVQQSQRKLGNKFYKILLSFNGFAGRLDFNFVDFLVFPSGTMQGHILCAAFIVFGDNVLESSEELTVSFAVPRRVELNNTYTIQIIIQDSSDSKIILVPNAIIISIIHY